MDEVTISKSIVVDFTELSMTMPAIPPRLITISIFVLMGTPRRMIIQRIQQLTLLKPRVLR